MNDVGTVMITLFWGLTIEFVSAFTLNNSYPAFKPRANLFKPNPNPKPIHNPDPTLTLTPTLSEVIRAGGGQ